MLEIRFGVIVNGFQNLPPLNVLFWMSHCGLVAIRRGFSSVNLLASLNGLIESIDRFSEPEESLGSRGLFLDRLHLPATLHDPCRERNLCLALFALFALIGGCCPFQALRAC